MTSRTYQVVFARSAFPFRQDASVDIRNHRAGICNRRVGICD
jgi:hypothetical protein